MRVALVITAAGLLIGLLVFGIVAQAPNTAIDDSLAQGHPAPAPAFDLDLLQRGELGGALERPLAPALADGRLSLQELRGIPIVLNIWASWCDPCRQEARLLERAWRTQGRPAGVLFLGLDQQDATGDAHVFMRQYGVDYLNVHAAGDDVPRSYGATGVPETYFISARGAVVAHVIGVVSPGELSDGIIAARTGQLLGVRTGGARRTSR
ncbi:MAG: TlpA family protein disulfide reductase [Actinomycetota bacterium]|nr:TlpA family protein disulfide reductase [Actinomycetota bacterium]